MPPSIERESSHDDVLRRRSSSVQFGEVEIREYERILGEYTELSNSLSIGWEFAQHQPVTVEEFEHAHLKAKVKSKKGLKGLFNKRKGRKSPENSGKSKDMEPTSVEKRQQILKGFGYSKDDLKKAEKLRLQKLEEESLRILDEVEPEPIAAF